MRVAKLSISYDRGIEHNAAEDLGLDEEPETTRDGGKVRGLGTHFRPDVDPEIIAARDREGNRVRVLFKNRFLVTPLGGVYLIEKRGDARRFLDTLTIRPDVQINVMELQLTSDDPWSQEDLKEWTARIKKQLAGVGLGRGKEADAQGLAALEDLAACPVFDTRTAARIVELIALVRAQRIDRLEFKRALEVVEIAVNPEALAPRRVPTAEPIA